MLKPFKITSVCRADVARVVDTDRASALSDIEMRWLGEKMGDGYVKHLFWEQIPVYLRYIEGARKSEALLGK